MGITRIGPRLASYFDALLKSRAYPCTEVDSMVFYWSKEQNPNQYDVYRPASGRDAVDIAPEEVRVAVCEVLDQQGALPEDALLGQVAKSFGFSRMRDNIFLAMRRGLQMALDDGKAFVEGGRVKLKK